jgi:hypothetical protein
MKSEIFHKDFPSKKQKNNVGFKFGNVSAGTTKLPITINKLTRLPSSTSVKRSHRADTY